MKIAPLVLLVTLIAVGCSRQDNPNAKTGAAIDGNITIPQSLIGDAPPDMDEDLVNVNGTTLTRREALRQMELRLGGPPPSDMPSGRADMIRSRVLSTVLNQFVKRTLLLEEADRLDIQATDEEVEKGLAIIKSKTPEGQEPKGILQTGPAGTDSIRNEVITGIRIDKLLAQKLPDVQAPTQAEIDTFIEKHRESLTHPETGMLPSEKVAEIIKRRAHQESLREYVKQLLQAADIKHAPSVTPPNYDEE
jgi:hypothetical protein